MLDIVILAAGQGTRMNSAYPKVLHPVGGRPLLGHVIDAGRSLKPHQVHVVYGHGGDSVRSRFAGEDLHWWLQAERLGTAHALMQALPSIAPDAKVLVLYGDVPLIDPQTLNTLIRALDDADLVVLTVHLDRPEGYGRIIRDEVGEVHRIVEHKDADEAQHQITEVNTGILAATAQNLSEWLSQVDNDNAKKEYYLTDCIELAARAGRRVRAVTAGEPSEVMGINDKIQLAHAERHYQSRAAKELMKQGATLLDPDRIDVRGRVIVGRDVTIDINVIFEGEVRLGDGVVVGAGSVIRDTLIGRDSTIKPYSVIDRASIGDHCEVGPFARIRPDTELDSGVQIGNFVEVKNSHVRGASQVNHLSYLGDSQIGARVNIGAGTITCNYDGAHKHRTTIGDDAFVGSNTALVAPVEVGDGATIGAGSTITRDAAAEKLTLARARQVTVEGWQRPRKNRE